MPAQNLVGQELQSTYRLDEIIGRGGSGVVYASSHLRLSRQFAIKVLAPGISSSDAFDRLRREAEITSRIAHPHIVEVIDFNHMPDGTPYLVMELLQGEDLAKWLGHSGRLDLEKVGSILRQTAAALHAAHEHGVVHRDLKPRNVFLCQRGKRADFVKVMDFGISKVLDSQSLSTTNQKIMGTARYMAPEQADGRPQDIDERTDIFALGVILYEMLTGQPAFAGRSPPAVLYQIVHGEPRPLRELRPNLPTSFQRVMDKALNKEPKRRYHSMEALWQAFVDAMDFTPGPSAFTEDRTFDSLLKDSEPEPEPEPKANRDRDADSGEVTIPAIAAVREPRKLRARDAAVRHSVPAREPAGPNGRLIATANVRPPGTHRTAVVPALKTPRSQLLLAGFIVAAFIIVTVLALVLAGRRHGSPISTPSRPVKKVASLKSSKAPAPEVDVVAEVDAGSPAQDAGLDLEPVTRLAARILDAGGRASGRVRRRPRRSATARRWRKKGRVKARTVAHAMVPPMHQPGMLVIQSTRKGEKRNFWAHVYLDGKKVGQTPLILRNLSPRVYRISLQRPGYGRLTRMVRVKSGKREKVKLELEKNP